MRNIQKTLVLIIIISFIFGCFSYISSAQIPDDVYDYTNAINVLIKLGVIWGYEDGSFGPDNPVERWQMSLWIAKLETGKTSTDDYDAIWRTEENNTGFKDIETDQAIGAIGYAVDNGIIVGRSDTIFDPTEGITYREGLTMAVRALGFGSSAMDTGYPWSYIDKAAELGLQNGITDLSYTDILTRAETAQILFNALHIPDADGKTYISDVFRFSTVIVTGTPAYRIIETDSVIKNGYVSFNILNSDGSINESVTYQLPATAFGFTSADADLHVGASFKVTTADDFKTLEIVIKNPSVLFDASEIIGQGTDQTASAVFTLGKDTYQAVEKYSSLNNVRDMIGNSHEILVFITNNIKSSKISYFKTDSDYNILDKNGNIAAYYAPAITGSYTNPYAQLLDSGNYRSLTDKTDITSAGGVSYDGVSYEYDQIYDTNTLVNNNRYSSAVAYDDNSDGRYDRLFYTYQEFCKISYDAVNLKYNINGGQFTVTRFIDGKTGEMLPNAPSGFIRYSYNPISKYITVYETYLFNTGLVTSVNTADSNIVIGGMQYAIGIHNFPGAVYNDAGIHIGLIGKQVNYILAEGVIIRILNSAAPDVFVVFDNLTGLTSAGYASARVYAQSNTASIITIATINGFSYQTYVSHTQQEGLSPNVSGLTTGMLFRGTKDALGFWHLQAVSDFTYMADKGKIDFMNNISHKTAGTFSPTFNQFNTAADTLFIVYNHNTNAFYTAMGIPNDSSCIFVHDKIFISYASVGNGPTAKFIYINNGSVENFSMMDITNVDKYDTIIYVDKNSKATSITNDVGNNTLPGNIWQYSKVLDMINGKFITVNTTYNRQLQAGKFYTVKNGHAEDLVNINDYSEIKKGMLVDYDIFYSNIITDIDDKNEADSAFIYLYTIEDGNIIVNTTTGVPVSVSVDLENDMEVYFYDGYLKGSRVILCIT